MRNGFLTSACGLLASASLALAQAPSWEPSPTAPGQLSQSIVGHINRQVWWSAEEAADPTVPPPSPVASPSPLAEDCAPEEDCGCVICGPAGRFWVSAEYLLWWIKRDRLPPLVTTSPPSSGGVLGQPGTTVLFGGSNLDHEARSGGRFIFGFWLDKCQTIGLETEYFFLASRSNNFTVGGTGAPGSPVLARPVFDVLAGRENAELVAFPGQLAGTVSVESTSRLWGASENLICNICCDCCYRVDLLAGFRYLQLDEGLNISENLFILPSVPGIGGSTILVSDQFATHNRFYGGQVGARAEYRWNRMYTDVRGLVAVGNTHQVIGINGTTVITPPGGPTNVLRGGLLGQPTNSGHFSRDEFSVVPEVGLNVGYQVTDHVRAFVGYTFLYWSDVVRPGDQIDRAVNLSQIPSTSGPGTLVGPARPAVQFKDTDFWAQGINVGLEFRY